jgi:hypothetical protein
MIEDDFSKSGVGYREAKFYVDDYMTAKRQGQTIDPDFKDPDKAQQLMEEFEKSYLYDGVMGTNQVSRVVSADFNQWLTKLTYEKVQERNGQMKTTMYKDLKHAHLVTYQETIAAIIHNLDPKNTAVPHAGSTLLFEVYSKGGQDYVRATLDGNPIRINGAEGGHNAEDFWEYIYSKTYSGSEESVCAGNENPEAYQHAKYSSFKDYARARYSQELNDVEATRPTKHSVSIAQVEPKKDSSGTVTDYRATPEPEYETEERGVVLNPINMQELYVPQRVQDKTFVHETYLPQRETTFIHPTRLGQIDAEGMTIETLISIPRVHFFTLEQRKPAPMVVRQTVPIPPPPPTPVKVITEHEVIRQPGPVREFKHEHKVEPVRAPPPVRA